MVDFWRLTRNQYARRVYDALKAVGVTATRMYEYRAGLERSDVTRPPNPPAGVRLELLPAAEVAATGLDVDFSLPVGLQEEEWVVVAFADGRPVGRTLVADTPNPYVDVLERPIPVQGVYVRRVFVAPAWRGRGVAAAALRSALVFARDELGVDSATALIAADNRPSQWLFEACGFDRAGVHEYARVGPFSRYRPPEH